MATGIAHHDLSRRVRSLPVAECAHHERSTSGTVTRRLIEIEALLSSTLTLAIRSD